MCLKGCFRIFFENTTTVIQISTLWCLQSHCFVIKSSWRKEYLKVCNCKICTAGHLFCLCKSKTAFFFFHNDFAQLRAVSMQHTKDCGVLWKASKSFFKFLPVCKTWSSCGINHPLHLHFWWCFWKVLQYDVSMDRKATTPQGLGVKQCFLIQMSSQEQRSQLVWRLRGTKVRSITFTQLDSRS